MLIQKEPLSNYTQYTITLYLYNILYDIEMSQNYCFVQFITK